MSFKGVMLACEARSEVERLRAVIEKMATSDPNSVAGKQDGYLANVLYHALKHIDDQLEKLLSSK